MPPLWLPHSAARKRMLDPCVNIKAGGEHAFMHLWHPAAIGIASVTPFDLWRSKRATCQQAAVAIDAEVQIIHAIILCLPLFLSQVCEYLFFWHVEECSTILILHLKKQLLI